jgi:hypothetical protein
MHRSGTSLVANLLSVCGLYLGEEQDLMPATVDNPKGYWEHRRLLILNNEILAELGGDWESPPTVIEGWAEEVRMNYLRTKAEVLLEEFIGHEPWGWKDPRTSLTLPFWMSLNGLRVPFWLGVAPKLKIVLCLRNPREVSRSLSTRKHSPTSAGLDLWLLYNQRILNSTLSEDRTITHYEAYFRDPQAELRRVLNFLDMQVSDELIDRASVIVSDTLRRHRSKAEQLPDDNMPSNVLELYRDMCREANYPKSSPFPANVYPPNQTH